MATRKKALEIAIAHGALIESDPAFGEATAYAPKGYLWRSNGCSVYCVNYGYSGDMPSVWGDLIEGMDDGLMEDEDGQEDAWWVD